MILCISEKRGADPDRICSLFFIPGFRFKLYFNLSAVKGVNRLLFCALIFPRLKAETSFYFMLSFFTVKPEILFRFMPSYFCSKS